MQRGRMLADLATSGMNGKKYAGVNKVRSTVIKKKTNNIPEYVNLFDQGRWEELQQYLNIHKKKSDNDICSRIFNKPADEVKALENKDTKKGNEKELESKDLEDFYTAEGKEEEFKNNHAEKEIENNSADQANNEGKEKTENNHTEEDVLEYSHAEKEIGNNVDQEGFKIANRDGEEGIENNNAGEATEVQHEATEEGKEKELENSHAEEEKKIANNVIREGKENVVENNDTEQGNELDNNCIEEGKEVELNNDEIEYYDFEEGTESNNTPYMVFSVSPTGELLLEDNHLSERERTSKRKLFRRNSDNRIENLPTAVATSDSLSVGCEMLDGLPSVYTAITIKETASTVSQISLFETDCNRAVEETTRDINMDQLHPFDWQDFQNASLANEFHDDCTRQIKPKPKKRSWDRKNFCLFCKQLVTNFSRHIVRWHGLEKEVIEYKAINDENLKQRKAKRQKITDDLRKRGNFLFNSSKSLEEDFIPSRRTHQHKSNPLKVLTTFDFRTCRFCLGMFKKKTFSIHVKNCPKKVVDCEKPTSQDTDTNIINDVFNLKDKEYVMKRDGILILPDVDGASELLKKNILPILNREGDEISLIASNDPLILSIGSLFLYSHQDKKDYYNVTKKLRDAARLLKVCRSKNSEIHSLVDCFKPSRFPTVIAAVQDLCGFNEETGSVSVVGMPARLSYIIKEGAKLVSCNAIMNNHLTNVKKEEIKTEISEFLMLLELRWKYMVSSNAEKTRKKQNSLKPKSLPYDGDVKTMANKLKEYELKLFNSLSQSVSTEDYESLCKVTIAHIIILNRRRPGEVARAELIYYLNRASNDELTPDVLETLSEEEKLTLPELTVFMVPGKLVHSVPILLTKQMKKNIDLLISCRNLLNISQMNRYLFARVATDNPFDGSKIIREIREKCSLQSEENMTATGLRHHLATKSQIFGGETFTENVCQFLGHSLAVHKKNYRIPLQAIQRGQIGHRLLQMESSGTHSIAEDYSANINVSSADIDDPDIASIENIELEPELLEKENSPAANSSPEWNPGSEDDSENDINFVKKDIKRSVHVRRRWGIEEKTAVLQHLGSFVKSNKNPGMHKCIELLRKEPVLSGRTWSQVNVLINNFIKGKTKLPSKFQHLAP